MTNHVADREQLVRAFTAGVYAADGGEPCIPPQRYTAAEVRAYQEGYQWGKQYR